MNFLCQQIEYLLFTNCTYYWSSLTLHLYWWNFNSYFGCMRIFFSFFRDWVGSAAYLSNDDSEPTNWFNGISFLHLKKLSLLLVNGERCLLFSESQTPLHEQLAAQLVVQQVVNLSVGGLSYTDGQAGNVLASAAVRHGQVGQRVRWWRCNGGGKL